MKKKTEYSYNERLFSSGIRKKLHTARFSWLANSLKNLNFQYISVLELGCFDGKVIDYLPVKPLRYLGLDANWEAGLDIARERWKDEPNFTFRECHTPEDMKINGERFDISICMDTLEHIPPELIDSYFYNPIYFIFRIEPQPDGVCTILFQGELDKLVLTFKLTNSNLFGI